MDRGGEKHPHRGFVQYRGHQYRNRGFTWVVGEDYGGGKQKERRRGREREIKEEREGVRGRGRECERGRKRVGDRERGEKEGRLRKRARES